MRCLDLRFECKRDLRFECKGPFPEGSLLVSWDVVSMFPNIDNNLGISAVRRALNSRSVNIPSTDCLVEAVEICSQGKQLPVFWSEFCSKTWHGHGTEKRPAVMQI